MDWGRIYITVAGVIGVVTGLLGFVDNAFVGDPANDAIFATDAVHNLIHVGTGVLALYIGLAMGGATQARGIIGFGILYLVLAVVLMASPSMFGLMQVDVNTADDVLHVALGLVTSAVGFAAYRAQSPPRSRHSARPSGMSRSFSTDPDEGYLLLLRARSHRSRFSRPHAAELRGRFHRDVEDEEVELCRPDFVRPTSAGGGLWVESPSPLDSRIPIPACGVSATDI